MPDIGPTLREARMRARIDINEVEIRTKIRAKYLRALENEEWELLPGPVYVKSFLRTYGDFLGLDTPLLIDDFRRRFESASDDHDKRPIAPVGRERNRAPRGPPPPWAIIGVVLVLIVVVLYAVGSLGSGGGTSSSPPSSAHARTTPRRSAPRTHPAAIPPTSAIRPRTVKLQLMPTGQVYVCLVNGAGARLIPGVIFAAGQRIPTKRAAKLLLTLGNDAVQMKVNGTVVNVPSSSSSIGFLLTPGGSRPLPVARQPRCA
ncbi:MAG: helix-turn-helix domain-containing protein [Solirubrobacteraceae bacterium]